MNTTAVGASAELVALEFLKKRGMHRLATNVRTRFYELDLVMLDGADIVIIEVKYRKNADFGGGEAAISYQKAHRLRNAAMQWVAQSDFNRQDRNIRIDVVVVTGRGQDCSYYPSAIESD